MLHTHSIILVPNWEVADVVVDNDNGGQAIDTEAERQIFGTHDSLMECTTCTGHSRVMNGPFSADDRRVCWNYKEPHAIRWLNFTLHEWAYIFSHSQQRHRIIRCYCCFYVRMFLLKPSQANDWFGQTKKLSFLDSVIIFYLQVNGISIFSILTLK